MSRAVALLGHAVRLRVLARYGGVLALVVAVLTSVPLVFSLVVGEWPLSLRYALLAMLWTGVGLLGRRVDAPTKIQANEALVLTTLFFILVPLGMTLPMCGAGLEFVDALFESISALTTTGLSTAGSPEGRPITWLFARAWGQWVGGLGIVVFSLAFIVRAGVTARALEVSELEQDDLAGSARARSRRILLGYTMLTVGGLVLLLLLGVQVFDALLYTLAAVSTGGFAPYDASLGGLGFLPALGVTLLCVAGATSLPFFKRSQSSSGLAIGTVQLIAVGVAGLVVAGLLVPGMAGDSWLEAGKDALLLAYSSQSTAGFSPRNLAELDAFSKVLLSISMMVGGGVGSTAGGIKIMRLLMLTQLLLWGVARTCLPRHALLHARLGGQVIGEPELRDAALVFALFMATLAGSWLIFLAWGCDPIDSLFEVSSAVGTVGLSVGLSRPELPGLLKGVLCIDMLLGRLEIVAWLVLLYPRTWIGHREGI